MPSTKRDVCANNQVNHHPVWLEIWQMEVKSVVFKGDLVENVYMQQTEGGIFKEEVLILLLLMCSPQTRDLQGESTCS